MANIKVLKQLRRVAEEAPDEQLHMTSFVDTNASCGTARCLIGWAIIDPWFQKHTRINDVLPADFAETHFGLTPKHAKILKEMFDIDGREVSALFAFHSYMNSDPHGISKADVLASIDALIEGHSIRPYAGLSR